MVEGVSAFDSLPKRALEELSLEVELDLFEFVHEMFAIEALPRNGHKIY